MRIFLRRSYLYIAALCLAGLALAAAAEALAFTEPSTAPPGGDVSAPINVGGTAQFKSGNFGIGIAPTANFEVNGYTQIDCNWQGCGASNVKINGNQLWNDSGGLYLQWSAPAGNNVYIGQDPSAGSNAQDLHVLNGTAYANKFCINGGACTTTFGGGGGITGIKNTDSNLTVSAPDSNGIVTINDPDSSGGGVNYWSISSDGSTVFNNKGSAVNFQNAATGQTFFSATASKVSAADFCLSGNTSICLSTVGGGSSGVSQIIAGQNITISPTSGTGVVTINATGGSGGIKSILNGGGLSIAGPDSNGAVTITDSDTGCTSNCSGGITSVTGGKGISVANQTTAPVVTNTGVTSLTAGQGVTLSGSTGDITISASGSGVNGSTNYITKFTNSTTLGNSSIFDNGNVGIGTTNPNNKLEVNGNITVDGGQINGINGGVSIGPVAAGWYSDSTNLAARFPGSSGNFVVQNNGGSSSYLIAGAGVQGVQMYGTATVNNGVLDAEGNNGYGWGILSHNSIGSFGDICTLNSSGGQVKCLSSASGGAPGGSNLQLQYNNAGSFGGSNYSVNANQLYNNTGNAMYLQYGAGNGAAVVVGGDGPPHGLQIPYGNLEMDQGVIDVKNSSGWDTNIGPRSLYLDVGLGIGFNIAQLSSPWGPGPTWAGMEINGGGVCFGGTATCIGPGGMNVGQDVMTATLIHTGTGWFDSAIAVPQINSTGSLVLQNNAQYDYANVYIGTVGGATGEHPVNLIMHNGAGYQPGGGSWNDTSDERLKTNIIPITGALSKIIQLNPVSFDWKNPDVHGGILHSGGFLAQEVAGVFPEFVKQTDAQGADKTLVGSDGKAYALNLPFEFDAYVVGAIKDLYATVIGMGEKFMTLHLTVGSSSQPSGITLYDDTSGQPYCVHIHAGQLTQIAGACN